MKTRSKAHNIFKTQTKHEIRLLLKNILIFPHTNEQLFLTFFEKWSMKVCKHIDCLTKRYYIFSLNHLFIS